MKRAVFLLLVAVGCDGAGCDKKAETPVSATESSPETPAPAPADPPEAAAAPRPARRTHLDLVAIRHLADVHAADGKLRVPFGTPATAKYTGGAWGSGFVGRGEADGVPFARVDTRAKVFLPVETPGPLRVTLRLRPVGASQITASWDDRELETRPLAGEGFQEIRMAVPAGAVHAGEGVLALQADTAKQVGEASVAYDLAWVEVATDGTQAAGTAPALSWATDDAGARLTIPRGVAARWYVQVPADATLEVATRPAVDPSTGARPAAPDWVAYATPEGGSGRGGSGGGGKRQTLSAVPVAPTRAGEADALGDEADPDTTAHFDVDLASLGGEVVALTVEARDEDLVVSDLAIRVPGAPPPPTPQVENVVLLTIDTLRASKLTMYAPDSRVKTPALAQLADAGALFERAQSPENWTKPAVASILTSLQPSTHETQLDASRLPPSVLTLGEILQEAGLETGSFIANGYVSNAFGFDQGWDHYTNYIRERKNTNASNVYREAGAWIEAHKDERFFAYIQTIDPHVPYDPPDEFLEMYDPEPYGGPVRNRRTHLLLEEAKRRPPTVTFDARDKVHLEALHDGEISYHDHHLAQFLARLDALGLTDKTLFIVTSDHGEEFEDHGSWGHGHSVYQELLGVPLIVRWPGVVEPGLRIPEVVSTLDIAPTILEALQVTLPDTFEGRSLMGFLQKAPPPGPHVAFSFFQDNRRVIRGGDYKLILRPSLTHVMFDLAADPKELTELDGGAHPIAMRWLRVLMGQFLGAESPRGWLLGGVAGARHAAEQEQMTPELCRQLVALGYLSAECDALLRGAM